MSAQHCLVPVDFRACSDGALAYAITLAVQLQARLTLLHVLPELALEVGAHMRQDKHGYPLITQRYAAIGMPSCLLASQQ